MFTSGTYFWTIFSVFSFLFLAGIFFRLSIWMRGADECGQAENKNKPLVKKLFCYKLLFLKTLFSRDFFRIIGSFFADGIIHVNLFKDSKLKWFIHVFMFWGFFAFTLISILHLIALALAPGWVPSGDVSWFVRVFGSLENRFTALVMDLSKFVIFFGVFLASARFLYLRKKMKSVELKDKSAGVLISLIAVTSFLYEASYFSAMDTPAAISAFAPGGFILSYLFNIIRIKWWMLATLHYQWFMVTVLFSIYIIGLLAFVAFIPYGKYSHMIFGPVVAVYNKIVTGKKHHNLA